MNVFIGVILALLYAASVYLLLRLGFERRFRDWQAAELARWSGEKQKAVRDSIAQSRAVLGGRFTEQMAPYLPDFSYDPTEARFIGSPIDLIVFPGLAQGEPREIVIIEIKSGKGQLTPQERKIRQLIEQGMVRWELIQQPGVRAG